MSPVCLHLPRFFSQTPSSLFRTGHQRGTTCPGQTGSSSPTLLIPANGIIHRALGHCKDAKAAAGPRGRATPLLRCSLFSRHTDVGMWEGTRRGDGQLAVEADWHRRNAGDGGGKHLALVLHPGQQESKQSVACGGRRPPSLLHTHSSRCTLLRWTAAL